MSHAHDERSDGLASRSESWRVIALAWCGWFSLMFNALARAVVALDPFPHWEMDPTVIWTPPSALGPTGAMALDCLALFGAGLAVLAEGLRARRPLWTPLILLGAGAIPVAYHAFRSGRVSPDDAGIGLSWLAAGAAGVAMMHLCRDERMRRVTLAIAIGVIGMLVARGALQVFVEHPRTVRNFEANRGAILGAHGWSEGSVMARGFERRLRQAEATGWFGLANVYASFAAGAAVALLGTTVLAWRAARSAAQEVPDGIAAIVTLGLLAGAAGVAMAGSKAGYAVSALGAVLLVIAWLGSPDRARPGSWLRIRGPIPGGPLALAVVGGVLIAVAVRGAIGEAIREPSILFRWFYLQGASRVFLEHPAWGVGPDGFKDAYMLAKPAVAPENVDSPHSILFDFAARLGLGGVAWGVLFFWMLWRCGAALTARTREAPIGSSPSRPELWLIVAGAAAPTLISAWIETSITTPESALARMVGLVAWIGLALAMAWVMRAVRPWAPCFAAAAIALAAHAQIEMTPVQPASAAWFMLVLGAAGLGYPAAPRRDPSRSDGVRVLWLIAPVALCAAAITAGSLVLRPVARWEREMNGAAEAVRPLAEVQARLAALPQTGPAGEDSFARIAAEVGAMVSRPPPTNGPEMDGAMTLLALARIDAAIPRVRAAGARVAHEPTLEALSRLHLRRASASAASGDLDGAAEHGGLAERGAEEAASAHPGSAPAWAWLGTVRATRAGMESRRDHLEHAIQAWERAAALDPHGMHFAHQIFSALVALGRLEEAREWGRRVLAANERLRLDPLQQLTDNQREVVERVVHTEPP